ncbi:LacI family DNA-binding transcriptional regulator [Enterocloster bolteae]|uniref:LacI family DNA-binding transcriptional regulator n=1 Tax=Enterocloster bolteae TaxID=208479 RepID=UPI001FF0F2E4|nr:LacI family DNA-binding transcriptional regulator [Enterocloster bolteae]UOX68051.1 LacI family transcriptional regulator [Enterocloster bolteae]
MKIKAVDIARQLGISKATVSLALNGKSGVSSETRDMILKCREEMESQLCNMLTSVKDEEQPVPAGMTIKIIMFDRKLGIICAPALNIWTEMLRIFDGEARKHGYSIGITYVGNDEMEIQRVVEECNSPAVAGVLLYATEMAEHDFDKGLRAIRKPMVIFDYDAGNRYHSVVIDNETAVQKAVEFLVSRGCRRIEYLSQRIEMYNFERRRMGFIAGIHKVGLDVEKCPIVPVGTTIESVDSFMRDWLLEHSLPDAFIMENYQISIGAIKALNERKIQVPKQISILGVDELPSYMTGGVELDCIRVAHTDRAYVTMELLLREIQSPSNTKFKVASRCELILGESVR